MITDDEIRDLWRSKGGNFHGPIIEIGTMPESLLLPFIRELITDADAKRLDFLDGNMRLKMSWDVGAAPFGNICVSSVIRPLGKQTSIREAIDVAMEKSLSKP